MPSDLVIPKVMDIDDTDERLWARNLPGSSPFLVNTADQSQVPQAPSVTFSPLLFNTSQGCFVNILHVERSGLLSCPTHGSRQRIHNQRPLALLEHDWWAEEGGYSFEPPGESAGLLWRDGDVFPRYGSIRICGSVWQGRKRWKTFPARLRWRGSITRR